AAVEDDAADGDGPVDAAAAAVNVHVDAAAPEDAAAAVADAPVDAAVPADAAALEDAVAAEGVPLAGAEQDSARWMEVAPGEPKAAGRCARYLASRSPEADSAARSAACWAVLCL